MIARADNLQKFNSPQIAPCASDGCSVLPFCIWFTPRGCIITIIIILLLCAVLIRPSMDVSAFPCNATPASRCNESLLCHLPLGFLSPEGLRDDSWKKVWISEEGRWQNRPRRGNRVLRGSIRTAINGLLQSYTLCILLRMGSRLCIPTHQGHQ